MGLWPLGAELKRNVKDFWWKKIVHERDDVVGLDSAILMHPRVWKLQAIWLVLMMH